MDKTNRAAKICLDVFAQVAATVTHEVNNVLAIINENAGYLDDLVLMVGEDGEIPGQRVKRSVGSISIQVGRANNLMKELNRFAHIGDVSVAAIDLAGLLRLMTSLTRRKAASAEITVDVQTVEPVNITTRPQLASALIYLCLSYLYERATVNSEVSCQVYLKQEGMVELRLTVAGDFGAGFSVLRENGDFILLADELEAGVIAEKNCLIINLPCKELVV